MASTSTSAAQEALVLFARGVIARLSTWPALRLAVDSGWGGPEGAEKRTWMASVVVDAFDPSDSTSKAEPPDEQYVEEMLLQMMADEFDTELEDGSAEEVAKDVLRLWSALDTNDGPERLVQQWEERAKKTKGQKVASEVIENEEEEDESGSDWEDEEEDEAPALMERLQRPKDEPVIDEDGFTMVKGKGKSHR